MLYRFALKLIIVCLVAVYQFDAMAWRGNNARAIPGRPAIKKVKSRGRWFLGTDGVGTHLWSSKVGHLENMFNGNILKGYNSSSMNETPERAFVFGATIGFELASAPVMLRLRYQNLPTNYDLESFSIKDTTADPNVIFNQGSFGMTSHLILIESVFTYKLPDRFPMKLGLYGLVGVGGFFANPSVSFSFDSSNYVSKSDTDTSYVGGSESYSSTIGGLAISSGVGVYWDMTQNVRINVGLQTFLVGDFVLGDINSAFTGDALLRNLIISVGFLVRA